MPAFALDHSLPIQLAVAASRTRQKLGALCSGRFGFGVAERRVIARLCKGGPASVRETHGRVDMDTSRVGRPASRFEASGCVLKRVNTGNQRLVEPSLTRKGQAMMDETAQMAAVFEAILARRLGECAKSFQATSDTFSNSGEEQTS